MYIHNASIEEIKKDTIKELIEEINQEFARQEFESIWINENGGKTDIDIGYAWEWWIMYRKELKKKWNI